MYICTTYVGDPGYPGYPGPPGLRGESGQKGNIPTAKLISFL